MSRTSLAGSGEADIESSTSGHDDGHNEETHTMPAILVALPEHLLVLASEWLFVKDLLTLRAVDRNFHAISKNQTLWKGMARHLWRAALVGRADDGYGLLDNCDARLQHQEKDNAGAHERKPCTCVSVVSIDVAIPVPNARRLESQTLFASTLTISSYTV